METRSASINTGDPEPQQAQAEELPGALVEEQIRQVLLWLGEGQDPEALGLLASLHPADQARVVGATSPEVLQRIAPLLAPEQWAAVLEHVDPADAVPLLRALGAEAVGAVLDSLPPEVAADLLRELPREEAHGALARAARVGEIQPLLAYAEGTAGDLMRPVTVTISGAATVAQAMARLRTIAPLPQEQTSFFVVDQRRHLTGKVSLHELVFSEPNALTGDVAEPILVSVAPDTDQEECSRLMQRYDLAELPVVDPTGRLLGVIPFQAIFNVASQEATEDVLRLARMGGGERLDSTLTQSVRQRLPWLLLNLGTVILGAAVITLFESTIAKMVALASFIPVVAGQGGAAGNQTLALMVRGIALGSVSFRRARPIVFRELTIGLLKGLFMGLILGVIGLVWRDNWVLGVALFVAMTANMLLAALVGALVPLGLRAWGVDPALGSTVLVTTCTDIGGFVFFLGTATVLLLLF